MNNIFDILSYSFMLKAFISGLFLALTASLIGAPLVLKKNANVGDGLSHAAFGAFAFSTVFNFSHLYVSIPLVMILSILMLKLNKSKVINEDAVIALISLSSLAIGTFLISVKKGVNVSISSYLFGSILSISEAELILSILLFIIVALFFTFYFHKLFIITFDEVFARSIGIKVKFYDISLAIIASLVVVIGMRIMGSLLISALIIFPTLSSLQIFKSFKGVVISNTVIAILAFTSGLILSYAYSLPTGSTIVIVNLFIFLLMAFYSKISIHKKTP